MAFRLPPLASLRFFEAAGRHRSFKLAASELNVTPSAVSHGIVALERTLGVELFVRGSRSLSLTPAGADYLSYIAEALSLIAVGTERLPSTRESRTLTVSVAPTVASRWLLPRLRRYSELWPNVGIAVDTSRRQIGFPVDGFDFAIRMSQAALAGPTWIRLFGERLVPVCSPGYREASSDSGSIDLRRATLLHVSPASEDWQAWLDRTGTQGVETTRGLRFDTIGLAFEAAAMGLGVVLGRRPLVDCDLASGALVEFGLETIAAQTAYWLVSSEGADHRSDLIGFKRFLLREAESIERRDATRAPDRSERIGRECMA
jgi:DNA-binding transcriptional LysR family regulator